MLPIGTKCVQESSSNEQLFRNLKLTKTALLAGKNLVKKLNGRIVLSLEEGKKMSFSDYSSNEDESLIKTYTYLGFSHQMNLYFVQLMRYESSDYITISKKGKIDTLWSQPYVSPQGKTAVALSRGLEYEVYSNGFQVYETKTGGLTKVCTKIIEKYEPMDLRWINEKSFVLKLRDPFSKAQPKKTVYRKYTLE